MVGGRWFYVPSFFKFISVFSSLSRSDSLSGFPLLLFLILAFLDIDDHPDIRFFLLKVLDNAHSTVRDRFHLGPGSVPLSVEFLPFAHRFQAPLPPVDPPEDAELSRSKPLGGEGEEELVEEGEEEGVEVVARGGEAAFCFCYKLFFSFFSLRLVFFVCLSLLYLSLSPSCSLSKI